ncbi:MAG: CvpA family protein [Gammaproteobacteria bacterium]|jgi:membrane protein required for colicin V production|nr:CvpA family protein [Gammaproteobacteria bacterium]MBT3725604.1 CvpA family protein [Gammaproteobacteria bacterium]MBT4078631.1 CvpA family protein [Gammaproteobacteria bacterium]MBT4196946.1 CvpA family protein [Gammaproteobacteria bacterium]MBT4449530.1 CvpA family protein [Gammaproteobacteria bacterium]
MAWFDIAILSVILVSTLISLIRGFVKESISLATWIVAGFIAMTYYLILSDFLLPYIESPTISQAVAFAILFITTLIIGAIINFMISQLVSKTGLSGTDKLLGMIFGAARGVLIISMIVLFAGLTPMPNEAWWLESDFVVYFKDIAVWIQEWMPQDIAGRFKF